MEIINNLFSFLSDTITYIFFVGVFYFFYRSLYEHYIFIANGKNNISSPANSNVSHDDLEIEELKQQPSQPAIQAPDSEKQIADFLSSEQTNNISEPANSQVLHDDSEIEELKQQPLQPAIQAPDSEKRIVGSLGLENTDLRSGATTNNSLVIVNKNEPLSSEAQDIKIQQSIVLNRLKKRVFVGATALIGVLVAGMFLSQFMNRNSKHKQLQQQPIQTVSNFNKPEETRQLAQNQLKTETTPQPTITPTTSPKTITSVVVQKVPKEAPTVNVPKIVTVERGVKPQPIVRASTIITPRPVSTKPEPVSPEVIEKNATPKKEVDSNRQNTATQKKQPSEKTVAVGTRVKAVLAAALFGETNFAANDNKNDGIFVIRLKQPLKNIDGTIALPIGTRLLTKISSISDSGMLQLNVTSIIRQDNNELRKIILPESAITITAPKGKPLIAIRKGQAISVRKASGNIWFLQPGTEVEVYINQPIQLVNLDSHLIPHRL